MQRHVQAAHHGGLVVLVVAAHVEHGHVPVVAHLGEVGQRRPLEGSEVVAQRPRGRTSGGLRGRPVDADAPILAGAMQDDVLDRWLFSGNVNLVRDVEVAGVRVVEDGRHRDRDEIAARYHDAMKVLLA